MLLDDAFVCFSLTLDHCTGGEEEGATMQSLKVTFRAAALPGHGQVRGVMLLAPLRYKIINPATGVPRSYIRKRPLL
jgi:hypothetical protein